MAISESSEHTESGFRRIPRHNLRSLSISGTRSTSSSRSATGCGGNGSGGGGTKFGSLGNNRTTNSGSGGNMEYAWLEPRHDPIATDTNLAEIDFEDFRNEDLAYAFSCGVSNSALSFFFLNILLRFCFGNMLFGARNFIVERKQQAVDPFASIRDRVDWKNYGTAGLVFSKQIERGREQSG